jgi:hypothetical protein
MKGWDNKVIFPHFWKLALFKALKSLTYTSFQALEAEHFRSSFFWDITLSSGSVAQHFETVSSNVSCPTKVWTSYFEDRAVAWSWNTEQQKPSDGMQYPIRTKISLVPSLLAIPFICVWSSLPYFFLDLWHLTDHFQVVVLIIFYQHLFACWGYNINGRMICNQTFSYLWLKKVFPSKTKIKMKES